MSTNTSKKRYAFIPLPEEDKDVALAGEIVVNRNTGHIFVSDGDQLISATKDLESRVTLIEDNAHIDQLDETYNTIRKGYRLYFDDKRKVRLDKDLRLPKHAYRFQIVDMGDESIHYLLKPSLVSEDAELGELPLTNNTSYWILFYNKAGNILTQHAFVAKKSENILPELLEDDKIINNIQITLVNERLTLGDSWLDAGLTVIANFLDGTKREITREKGLLLDLPDIHTPGIKTIKASFMNYLTDTFSYAQKTISVEEELILPMTNIAIETQVIITRGGTKNIKLKIYAEFADGSKQNITDKCTVTGFDNTLFNERQIVTISTDYGREDLYVKDVLVEVPINDEPYVVMFNTEILKLSAKLDHLSYKYFRVRKASDLNQYNTLHYAYAGCETHYIGTIKTDDDLIIEYYNDEKELERSYYAKAVFRKNIPTNVFKSMENMF